MDYLLFVVFIIVILFILIIVYLNTESCDNECEEKELVVLSTHIPQVYTPGCSYGVDPTKPDSEATLPAKFLERCTQPLPDSVADLRGTWLNEETGVIQQIEQCGLRIIITGDGVVHDVFLADGTLRNGVHDVNFETCDEIFSAGVFNKEKSSFSFYTEDYYEGLAPVVVRTRIDAKTLELNYAGNISRLTKID